MFLRNFLRKQLRKFCEYSPCTSDSPPMLTTFSVDCSCGWWAKFRRLFSRWGDPVWDDELALPISRFDHFYQHFLNYKIINFLFWQFCVTVLAVAVGTTFVHFDFLGSTKKYFFFVFGKCLVSRWPLHQHDIKTS